VTLNTYYIRMVAEDDKGNEAEHSNPVSLTIADPRTINLWVSFQFLLSSGRNILKELILG